jgi:hypothetical protein
MPSEPEFFYDVEQGSGEWFELRRGIPTASEFATILSKPDSKGYLRYKGDLGGELLSGALAETYQSAAMLRGKEMEAEAADYYARLHLRDLHRCGFVRRKLSSGRYVGCSPDRLFDDTVLEIKTMMPRLMMDLRENGYDPHALPAEHVAQCQGALWVTGFPRIELIIYYRGMPYCLHYSVGRDEQYIKMLAAAVEKFDQELHARDAKHRGFQ